MVSGNCANCHREEVTANLYCEFAGRIHHFCSQRCHDRFCAEPTGRLIVSTIPESEPEAFGLVR